MHFHPIPCFHGNATAFHLGSWSGALFSSTARNQSNHAAPKTARPAKVHAALRFCNAPYLLPPKISCPAPACPAPLPLTATPTTRKILGRLLRLSRWQFLLARLYAAWRCPLFNSAREAIAFFREHAPGDQSELCLARALFAAKTSRQFPSSGVVIIGVFLPARSLHAWVIEGGELADASDDLWINFQPVAVLS